MATTALKARSRLGKYRILRRIGEGGFAVVYHAYDTIEGIDVALKVPHRHYMNQPAVDDVQREVRLSARLEHPNILPIKNAEVIDEVFVIAYPLGVETLEARLQRRLIAPKTLALAEQAIDAVAYAHRQRIIHCDIKPDNLILFNGGHLRLADFGIARAALRRMSLASGQGTVGYMAPEQALGKPTFRSDVFSLGLVVYRMFAGVLPEWPYDWPPPSFDRLRQVVSPGLIAILQRCLEVDDRKRFADAEALRAAFARVRASALNPRKRTRRRVRRTPLRSPAWRTVRKREFLRRHGRALEARASCPKCVGPISESMRHCPWCAHEIKRYSGPARFPGRCPRCARSAKRDWRYCAYCYGPSIEAPSPRSYSDRRYRARCSRCRGALMPFMRYCPHCRSKTTQRWPIEQLRDKCSRCGWGVLHEFWEHCPWCGKGLRT